MARIRTIKPDTFTSEDVNGLSRDARWTFVGLWCFVDDAGRGRADPRLIKAAVWPIDDEMTPKDIAGHLDEMERRRMICRYEVNDVTYMHVVSFEQHQRINRATESKLPPCSKDVHGGLTPPDPIDPRPLTEDSLILQPKRSESSHPHARAPEVEQGTGNREQGTPTVPAASPPAASVTQRSKQITDAYSAVQPMSRWPAINGIVIKAIKANKWADSEIHAALQRLAAEGRPVTVESLRIELDGLPPRASPFGVARPSTTDLKVAAGLALAAKYEALDNPQQALEIAS